VINNSSVRYVYIWLPCGGQSGTEIGFSLSTSVFPVSIVSSMLLTHLHIHVVLSRRANGRTLRTLKKQYFSGSRGELDRKVLKD
jgi:hypothetical protein